MIKRLGAQQDRLFGDQTDFVYYWPGAVRIAEKSSAFDVGRDTGTQVSSMYTDPFPFNRELDRMTFIVSDDDVVPPRDMPTQNY